MVFCSKDDVNFILGKIETEFIKNFEKEKSILSTVFTNSIARRLKVVQLLDEKL